MRTENERVLGKKREKKKAIKEEVGNERNQKEGLQEEVTRLKLACAELDEIKRENDSLSEGLRDKNERLVCLQAQFDSTKQRADELAEECRMLKGKCDEMERRLEQEQERILEHNQAILSVNTKEQEIRSQQSKIESLNQEVARTQAKLKDKKARCKELQLKSDDLQRNMDTLVFNKKSMEVQFKGRELEIKTSFEEQIRTLNNTRSQLNKSEKKRIELMSRFSALEEENKRLSRELETLSKTRPIGAMSNFVPVPMASGQMRIANGNQEREKSSGNPNGVPASGRSVAPVNGLSGGDTFSAVPLKLKNSTFQQGTVRVYYSKPFFTNALGREESDLFKKTVLSHGGQLVQAGELGVFCKIVSSLNTSGFNGVSLSLEYVSSDRTKSIRNFSASFLPNTSLDCIEKERSVPEQISPDESARSSVLVSFKSFPYRLLEVEFGFKYFPFL